MLSEKTKYKENLEDYKIYVTNKGNIQLLNIKYFKGTFFSKINTVEKDIPDYEFGKSCENFIEKMNHSSRNFLTFNIFFIFLLVIKVWIVPYL